LSVGKKSTIGEIHSGNVIGKMEEAVVKLSENFASTAKFAREIGDGNYQASYSKLSEEDELGNALLLMRNKLADYSHSMEEKVAERTLDLENKQKELQIVNQDLSASEEEIRQNSEELMAVNEHLKDTSAKLEDAFNKEQDTNQKLETILSDLKETQSQLVQAEKMSSLGQLTAGVAHEINNPINFVYAGANTLKDLIEDLSSLIREYNSLNSDLPAEEINRKLAEIDKKKKEMYFDEIEDDIKGLVDDILHGAERTQAIVKSLRTFTRLDENELKQTNLHENLDSTLIILNTKLQDRVEIVKDYSEFLPDIECFAGPINQVFMNVISNAVQAIKDKGEIVVCTIHLEASAQVQIEISDNGKGMSEETKQKLFDPFYTTKDVGEGTGLGLSIVHGIIEKHKGEITVESELGKGSIFRIVLPVRQE
jgi:signal transduction histidine kinase